MSGGNNGNGDDGGGTWLTEERVETRCRFRYTSVAFGEVVGRLHDAVGRGCWTPSREVARDPAVFRREIEAAVAVGAAHGFGFVVLGVVDHGFALARLGVAGRGVRSVRFSLGNPLVAADVQRLDPDAGLHLPVQLLVRETLVQAPAGGRVGADVLRPGTVVSYVLPSGMIARREKGVGQAEPEYRELLRTVTKVDDMLERLVDHICTPKHTSKARL